MCGVGDVCVEGVMVVCVWRGVGSVYGGGDMCVEGMICVEGGFVCVVIMSVWRG